MWKPLPLVQKDEQYVSYNLLFTSIPLKETIDYIINKINNESLLKPMCKSFIFKQHYDSI